MPWPSGTHCPPAGTPPSAVQRLSDRPWRSVRTWLAAARSLMLTALLPVAPALAAVPPTTGCPPEVVALIDGLYRWQLARQNQPGPMLLFSQRERFTPKLYSQLVRAAALEPGQGGFLDFDVFSGTQVSTFGARVDGCTSRQDGLQVAVAVQAGLRGRTSEPPQQLRYRLQQDPSGRWRIADIIYLQSDATPPFTLSGILADLLRPAPPTRP
jgi:hypothetical protein